MSGRFHSESGGPSGYSSSIDSRAEANSAEVADAWALLFDVFRSYKLIILLDEMTLLEKSVNMNAII